MEAALQEGLLAAQRRQPFQAQLVEYATSRFPQAPDPAPASTSTAQPSPADVQGSKAAVEAASAHVGLRVELLKSMRAALLRQTEGALKRSEAAAAAAVPGPKRGKTRRRGTEPTVNPNNEAYLTEETQFFDREAHQRMQEALAAGGGAFDESAARAALFPGSNGVPELADRSLCLDIDAEAPGVALGGVLEDRRAVRELAATRAAAAAAPAARPSVVGADGVRRTFAGDILARRMQELELSGIEVLPPPTAAAAGEEEVLRNGFDGFEMMDFGVVEGADGYEGQGFEFEWPDEIQIEGSGSGGDGGSGIGSQDGLFESERMHVQNDQDRGMERPAAARLPPSFARPGRPAAAATTPDGGSDELFVPESQGPAPRDDLWEALEDGNPEGTAPAAAANTQQEPRRLQLPSFRRAVPSAPALQHHTNSTPSEFDRIEDSSDGEGGGVGGAEAVPRLQPPLRSVAIPSRQTGFAGTVRAPAPLAVRAAGTTGEAAEEAGAEGPEDSNTAAASETDVIQDPDAPDTRHQARQPPQFERRGGRVAPAPLPGPRLRLSWEGAARDPLILRPSVLLQEWAGNKARWRPARREEDLLLTRRTSPALFASTTAIGTHSSSGLDGLGLPSIVIDQGIFERSLLLPGVQEQSGAAGAAAVAVEQPGETFEAWRLQALRVMGGGSGGSGAAAAPAQAQQWRQGAAPADWWKDSSDEEDAAMDWHAADNGSGGGGGGGSAAAARVPPQATELVEITFDEDDSGAIDGGPAAMAEDYSLGAGGSHRSGRGGGGGGQRWATKQPRAAPGMQHRLEEDEDVEEAAEDLAGAAEDVELRWDEEEQAEGETGAGGVDGEEEEYDDAAFADLMAGEVEVVGWGDGGSDGGGGGAGGDLWGGEDMMAFEGDMGGVDVCFDDDDVEGEEGEVEVMVLRGGGNGEGGGAGQAGDRGRRLQALQTGVDRIREAALQQWRAQKRASALAARLLRPALARAIAAHQDTADAAQRCVTMVELRQEASIALGGTVPGFAAALGALAAVVAAANAAVVGQREAGEASDRDSDPQPRGPLRMRASADRTDVIVSW